MIRLLRAYRAHLARKRFQALVRPYDDAIEAARRAHGAVRPLQQAKASFVHSCLGGIPNFGEKIGEGAR